MEEVAEQEYLIMPFMQYLDFNSFGNNSFKISKVGSGMDARHLHNPLSSTGSGCQIHKHISIGKIF